MDGAARFNRKKHVSENIYVHDRMIAQRTLSLVSFLVPLILFGVYLIAPHASDSGAESRLLFLTSLVILITGTRLIKNWNVAKSDRYQLVGVFIDFIATALILITYSYIYQVPISAALKSPTANIFFIYLASRVVLFKGPIMVKTGIIAITTWVMLILMSLYEPNSLGRTNGYVDYLTSFKILLGAEVERLLQFGIITIVLRSYILSARSDPHTGLLRRSPFLESMSKFLGSGHHKHADSSLAFIEIRTMDISKSDAFYSSIFSLIPNLSTVKPLGYKRIGRLSLHSVGVWMAYPHDTHSLNKFLENTTAELSKAAIDLQGIGVPDIIIGGTFVKPKSTAEELMSQTDMAIRHGLENGQKSVIYNDKVHAKILHKINIEHTIRQGLETGQVSVKYQPIVDLMTSKPVGFEALIRLCDSNNDVVSPDIFVPIAETSDLINKLTSELCDQVARDGAAIARAYVNQDDKPYININISPAQLKDMTPVMQALDRARKGSGLKINAEITESSVLHEADAVKKMHVLRDKGYAVAIDDFGTGYSSLHRLKEIDFSTLKIDKIFVDDIEHDVAASNFLTAMVKLAKISSKTVIIEGVETVHQQALIMKMGVRYCQGYLFAKPMGLQDLMAYLADTYETHNEILAIRRINS